MVSECRHAITRDYPIRHNVDKVFNLYYYQFVLWRESRPITVLFNSLNDPDRYFLI